MSKYVWMVFIEGTFIDGETTRDVYKVFGNQRAAELSEKWVRENKYDKKINGMWVDEVWVSDKCLVHEEAKP